MKITKKNIFQLQPDECHQEKELFQTISDNENIRIEKIISNGQTTPEGFWYNQDRDEWVILLQGEAKLKFENDTIIKMKKGDYLLIPAHCRHRVVRTSKQPHCIWLAIHAALK